MSSPDEQENRVGGPSTRRRRARRLFSFLAIACLILLARKAAPRVEDRLHLFLAERAVAAGRLEEGRARLSLMISERPGCTEPRLLLARIARLQGRITEAEEILQRAIELGLPIAMARPEHDLIVKN